MTINGKMQLGFKTLSEMTDVCLESSNCCGWNTCNKNVLVLRFFFAQCGKAHKLPC